MFTESAARRRENMLLGLAGLFLLASALALVVAPSARTGTWDIQPEQCWPLGLLGIWGVCAGLAVGLARRAQRAHDPYLLPLAFLLSGWGLLVIWRLTPGFGLRQAAWLGLSTLVLAGLTLLPGDLRWLRRYRYTWLLAGLALTALTLLLGVNPSGAGARLWLGCCGMYLQPAEVLKLLLVVFLAAYLADRRVGPQAVHPHNLLPMLLMWGFSMVILVSQRDLGMSTLYFAVFLCMLYLATGQLRYLVAGLALLLLGAAAGYLLFDVVRRRVAAWWDPWADPAGGAYQIVQSLIAIASGGVLGRGLGMGAPGVIPVVHSDFVFSAIAEEFGLLGSLAVIGLTGALVVRGLRIAMQASGAFEQLLAAGLSVLMGVQALMIVGGILRLVPLTGLTLPFLSYGGSSLLAQFIAVGLLLRLSAPPNSPLRRGLEKE